MDWTQIGVTAVTVLISSGIIQFFVKRADDKKEKKEKNEIKTLKEEFSQGLKKQSEESLARHNVNGEAIKELKSEYQRDFKLLKDAIEKLTENDTKITDTVQKMSEKQDIIAESLIGHAHDRIMWYTDKITERGSITNTEKATIQSMYDPYVRLGGNGVVKESVTYVRSLPTVTEEEARIQDAKIRNMYSKVV